MPTHPAQTKLLNTTAGFKIILPLQDTWRHHTQHFTPNSFEASLITKRLQTSQPSQRHQELYILKKIPLFWHMALRQWVRSTWHFTELVWFFNSVISTVSRLWSVPHGVQFQVGVRNFFLIHNIQISSGAHKPLIQWVPTVLTLEVTWPQHKVDNSHPPNVTFTNA
jgi:hypothetical protein